MTEYIRKKFNQQLRERYDQNQIKMEHIESKYSEHREAEPEEVVEWIEDIVDLDDWSEPAPDLQPKTKS